MAMSKAERAKRLAEARRNSGAPPPPPPDDGQTLAGAMAITDTDRQNEAAALAKKRRSWLEQPGASEALESRPRGDESSQYPWEVDVQETDIDEPLPVSEQRYSDDNEENARRALEEARGRVASLEASGIGRLTLAQSNKLERARKDLKNAQEIHDTILSENRRLRRLRDASQPEAVEEPPVDRQEAPIFAERQDPSRAMEKVREAETGERTMERGAMGVWDVFPRTGTVGEVEYARSRGPEKAMDVLGEHVFTGAFGVPKYVRDPLISFRETMRESPTLSAGMGEPTPPPPVAGGIAMAPYAPAGVDIAEARNRVNEKMTELARYKIRYNMDIPRLSRELAEMAKGPTGQRQQQKYADKQAELQFLIDQQDAVDAEYKQLQRILDVTLGERPLVSENEIYEENDQDELRMLGMAE